MTDQTSMPPFAKDPATIVRQEQPFNAGPPLPLLRESFVTPNARFFVRSHGNVPTFERATYRLNVGGMVARPQQWSLAELQASFERHTVMATLQCAGNRRQDLLSVAPIPGELPWGAEAISNATWSGFRLADILDAAQIDSAAAHVAFCGLDETERHDRRFNFGGSIPLPKALHPDTLLADTMNDEPLPPVHGAPLRVIVPGYIGARSVKWLATITLQCQPSDNYFQAVAYRLFPATVNHSNVEWDAGMMLGELSLNAVICSHAAGEIVAAGAITVQGYATAGGGREVARVDLSTDGGATWQPAQIAPAAERWAWRFWLLTLDLAVGEHELVVRMIDSAANTQPADASLVWNFKGYMSNAWHRVKIWAEQKAESRMGDR